jgi:hypothetical protein
MRRIPKLSFAQGQLMLWILVGSIVAFGAMFLFFRVSGVSLTRAPREGLHINFMPTTRQDPLLVRGPAYVIADVFDPSLMSLPNPHGFSKRVWSRKIEASQRDLGWNQQPGYLGVTPPALPAPLLQPEPVDASVMTVVEKASALSEESNGTEALAGPLSINQTVYRVLGALEDRGVAFAPVLPTITNAAPLAPTQIRVGANADGLVLYAMLDRSSGDDGVDAKAMDLARQIRFEADHSGGTPPLTWGVLRFLWAAEAPVATNSGSAASQP